MPEEVIIPEKYLQVETKEDSAEKLAYAEGKPTKNFWFAIDFETLREYVCNLRDLIDVLYGRPLVYEAVLAFQITEHPILMYAAIRNELPAVLITRTGVGSFRFYSAGLNADNYATFLTSIMGNYRVAYMYTNSSVIDFQVINRATGEPEDLSVGYRMSIRVSKKQ